MAVDITKLRKIFLMDTGNEMTHVITKSMQMKFYLNFWLILYVQQNYI